MTKKLGQEINWKNGQRLVRNQELVFHQLMVGAHQLSQLRVQQVMPNTW
jgi:hypothetical protein